MSDDSNCNLAHMEINHDAHLLGRGVPADRFTMEYLSQLPQNVQNLDVGLTLELSFRRLNLKYAKCVQNFTNAFRSR